MTAFTTILYETDADGILFITLNRPDKMNSFTPTMCEELVTAFAQASTDDTARAVIVNGAGRAFCAGMDLSGSGNVFGLDESLSPTLEALEAGWDAPALKHGVRDTGGRVTLAIRGCTKPVIAAIHGAAVGIGATMTLAMDIRLATADARIGFVFGRLGIMPEACSTWYLPRLVGIQRALEWSYAAEPFSAQEGLEAGLLRSLHSPEELLPVARELARRFTAHRSPAGIAATREMMWRNSAEPSPVRAHLTESLLIHHLSQRGGKEGVAAFLEKRAPEFTPALAGELPAGFPWQDYRPGRSA